LAKVIVSPILYEASTTFESVIAVFVLVLWVPVCRFEYVIDKASSVPNATPLTSEDEIPKVKVVELFVILTEVTKTCFPVSFLVTI
jgi:hypothetical protein